MALVLGRARRPDRRRDARRPRRPPARFTPPREEAFDFTLRDQDGRVDEPRDARGKVVVLTFLYTSCRDLCPAQAAEIVDAVERRRRRARRRLRRQRRPGRRHAGARARWLETHGLVRRAVRVPDRHARAARAGVAGVRDRRRSARRRRRPRSAGRAYDRYEGAARPRTSGRPYEPPAGPPPPEAAREALPDTGDLSYRGRARHAAGPTSSTPPT